jgi:hypothetical protein
MSEDGVTFTATSWKVSVTEKRSTGDYENVQPHATLEGEFGDGVDVLDNREAVRQQLLDIQRDLRAVVERTADNHNRASEFEDWRDPLGGGE